MTLFVVRARTAVCTADVTELCIRSGYREERTEKKESLIIA